MVTVQCRQAQSLLLLTLKLKGQRSEIKELVIPMSLPHRNTCLEAMQHSSQNIGFGVKLTWTGTQALVTASWMTQRN
jgi:hypothetical protein